MRFVAILVTLVLGASAAFAHHSVVGEFDTGKAMTLKGVVRLEISYASKGSSEAVTRKVRYSAQRRWYHSPTASMPSTAP